MKRRQLLCFMGGVAGLASYSNIRNSFVTGQDGQNSSASVLGTYVHEGWPYNHPYAARTGTVEDGRGYADGLKRLGYNTLAIWTALKTMPDPLTPSDRANIEKTAQVIDVLHNEFG